MTGAVPPVLVFYEDQRAVEGDFGLHELVLRCVWDELTPNTREVVRSRYALSRSIKAIPKKGKDNVLKALEKDALRLLGPNAVWLFVVLDRDQIHRSLKVMPGTCLTALSSAVLARCPQRARTNGEIKVVFIDANTETLLAAIAHAQGPDANATAARAIEQKEHNARDRMFKSAAHDDERDDERKAVLANPSFAYLVRRLACLVEHWCVGAS